MTTKKIAQEKTNGRVDIKDGEIVLTGKPDYSLPSCLNNQFLIRFLSSTPESIVFIGEVLPQVKPTERKRMYEACKSIGGNTWDVYKAVAKKWASIINDNNTWNLEQYNIIYTAEVGAPYIERVAISDGNFRFVITPFGVMSYQEFKWRYQQDVAEHIEQFKQSKVNNLDTIIECVTSVIVSRYCIVYTPEGVQRRLCTGLDSQPPERWKMPTGVQFLSEDTQDDDA